MVEAGVRGGGGVRSEVQTLTVLLVFGEMGKFGNVLVLSCGILLRRSGETEGRAVFRVSSFCFSVACFGWSCGLLFCILRCRVRAYSSKRDLLIKPLFCVLPIRRRNRAFCLSRSSMVRFATVRCGVIRMAYEPARSVAGTFEEM